jgi:hypothetical protein
MVGEFAGTLHIAQDSLIGINTWNSYITKLDPSGNIIWTTQIAGYNSTDIKNIAVDDSGNCYLTGDFLGYVTFGNTTLLSNFLTYYDTASSSMDTMFQKGIFLAKYNTNGTVIWAKNLSQTNANNSYGIDIDAQHNIFIAGTFYDSLKLSDSIIITSSFQNNLFLAKFDINGNPLWANYAAVDDLNETYPFSLKTDQLGNCFITGGFRNNTYFDSTPTTSWGGDNVFIARYNNDGSFQWVRTAGCANGARGFSIALNDSGNLFITGSFNYSKLVFETDTLFNTSTAEDIFVAKYDVNGNYFWFRKAGGTSYDIGRGIAPDQNGGCFVTGNFRNSSSFSSFTLTSSGPYDSFIAHYDENGNVISLLQGGGSGTDIGFGIASDQSGFIYTTGIFRNVASFGNQIVSCVSEEGAYISKLSYTISGLEDNNINNNSIGLYPNPTTEIINIFLNKSVYNREVKIFDLMGRTVYSEVINGKKKTLHCKLNPGMYIVQINNGSEIFSRRIIFE